ncbi:hypothetical protein ACFPH6_51815 [Streptomyces xiangluensis]|uniref:Polysaccharide deacetylase n=1 Tax=Streptomyces xiangluensis TaxID=2665720 RepID=A0ABV8Z5V6_9ACTN
MFSQASIEYLTDHRYTTVLWNTLPHEWDNPLGWVEPALEMVAEQDWAVVVVHDLPTGAMDRLPAFLDGLAAMDVEFVTDFPDECTPIKQGVLRSSLSHLTNGAE